MRDAVLPARTGAASPFRQGLMIDLWPELSFGDNLRPSQVTSQLRGELADWERRKRNQLVLVPSILMLVPCLVLLAKVPDDARGFIPRARILGWQIGLLATFLLASFLIFSRRIRLLRDAEVTTAAVLENETTTLWVLGASQQGFVGKAVAEEHPRNA